MKGLKLVMTNVLDVLQERNYIEQMTHPEQIKELLGKESVPFYIGIDPTADSLHVGHFVSLMVASYMQKNGHKPIILVGGGTAIIGDPSGKTDMRKMLTKEDLDHNVACIKKQVEKFVSFEVENAAIIVSNADWLCGVCGAIFKKAGRGKLREACRKIGNCKTGGVKITDGFDLPAEYIIHAVGPVWQGGDHDEKDLLTSAYLNALHMAMINGCSSIAFPLISAGIYGYPKQEAWRVAIESCMDFLDDFEECQMDITFAVIDDEMLSMGKQILQDIKKERGA